MAVSRRLRFEILRRDDHTCRYCGRSAPEVKLTVDHVVPEALGGSDEPSNLVAACDPCNGGKTSIAPDSPLVDDVAEDAIRWAKAIELAAEQMLSARDARTAEHEQFDQWWSGWSVGTGDNRRPVPRPDRWHSSVDAFLAAGLPLVVIKDCIDTAMTVKKIKPEDTFRYMCGIAWRRVGKLQDAARGIVGTDRGSAAPADETEMDQLLRFTAGILADEYSVTRGNDLIGELLRWARDDWNTEADGEPSDSDLAPSAIRTAIDRLNWHRYSLLRAMEVVLEQLPAEQYDRCLVAAIDEAREDQQKHSRGVDLSEADVLSRTARLVATEQAETYLAELPEAERDEWLACAHTCISPRWLGTDMQRSITQAAAEYARSVKSGRGVLLRAMCTGPGNHGAKCPRKATFKVWLNACPPCGRHGQCDGHLTFCEQHMTDAVDGTLVDGATHERYDIRDFKAEDNRAT